MGTRETIALFEINQPQCPKRWGENNAVTGNCSASFLQNGVVRKCFNTRATCSVPADYTQDSYLYLPGVEDNYVVGEDVPIVSDLDVRIKVSANDWTPGSIMVLAAKWGTIGVNERSWIFTVNPAGTLNYRWSADGLNASSVNSSAATGLANDAVKWLRVTHDLDNGAAGNDVKFWTSDDGVEWTQLGATQTTASATSIFNSVTELTFGQTQAGNSDLGASIPLAGKLYFAEVRDGIDGEVVAQFNPARAEGSGATTVDSLTGETWTVNSTAVANPAQIVCGFVKLRMGHQQDTLLQYGYVLPIVEDDIGTSPCTVNLGGMDRNLAALGKRESVTVRLHDFKHSDLLVDPYRLERSTGVASIKYLELPGARNCYAATLDSAAVSITGDFEVSGRYAPDLFPPAQADGLVYKAGSYDVRIRTDGKLQAYFWLAGGVATAVSSAAADFASGGISWWKVTRASATGTVQFFTSQDGETFTQLGTDQATAAGAIADTFVTLDVGRSGGSALRITSATTGSGVNFGNVANRSSSAMSVEMWIQPSGTPQFVGMSCAWVPNGWLFTWNTSGKMQWAIGDALSVQHSTFSAQVLPSSQPTHVLGTYDGQNLNLYINGVLEDTEPLVIDTINITSSVVCTNRSAAAVDVLVDGCRLYNRGLTADEALARYRGQHVADGLIGAWEFDDAAGTTAADTSGVGNPAGTFAGGGAAWDTPLAPTGATGKSYYVELLDSIGGVPAAVFDPTECEDGALSFFSPVTSELWEVSGYPIEWDFTAEQLQPVQGSTFAPTSFVRAGATTTRWHLVERYLSLPGASGSYASTPDSEASSVTGDIDVRIKAALNDWSPASIQMLLDKRSGGTQAYQLRVEAAGFIDFILTQDGATPIFAQSTVAPGFADGSAHWLRATRSADTGVVRHYTSDDYDPSAGTGTWTQLGADVATPPGVIFDGDSFLGVGGAGFPASGKFYYAEVRDGIDGEIVAKFDPSGSLPSDTQVVSDTGETWSINGAACIVGAELETVAADAPRFDYDPLTLERRAQLIEEARTNLCLRSNALDNASWTKNGVTVTADVATAPDGTVTAEKTALTATTAPHLIYQGIARAAGIATYSASIYFKAAELTSVFFRLTNDVSSAYAQCRVDLSTGTLSDQSNATFTSPRYSIEDAGGGWYRVKLTATTDAVTSGLTIQWWPQVATSGGLVGSETGDGSSGIYAWGGQMELGAVATSYIPTTSAAVTRNADVATVSDVSGFLNASEGTIVAEADVIPGGAAQRLFTFDKTASATYADMIQGWVNDAADLVLFEVFSGGVGQTSISPVGFTDTTVRQATAYKANDFAEAVNGALTTDSAGLIPAVDQLFLGSYGKDSTYLNGHLRRLAYYPRRLTNDELVALSGGTGSPLDIVDGAPSVAARITADDAYEPFERGTFWGKWKARNQYFSSYPCTVREGYVGDALSEMTVRRYVLDRIDGPADGRTTIVAKDLFSKIEARKSVAPLPSQGELSADLVGTPASFSLLPAGIGDAEYPASGYVAIGKEIIQFTRVGDIMTIVARGALNTKQEDHDEQDLVQLVLEFSAQKPHDIIYTLLVNYTDIDPAALPKARWDAVTVDVTDLYTARIAKPEPVVELIGELCEQIGYTVFPNVFTGQIELVPLRASTVSTTVDDEGWILDGQPFSTKTQDSRRASQVWVYYGQKDPTGNIDDEQNFFSRVVRGDLEAEGPTQYGTASVRKVFSRWIPQFGRTAAIALGDRILTMFRDPPLEAKFFIDASRRGELSLTKQFFLETREVQNEVGVAAVTTHAVTAIENGESKIGVSSQQIKLAATVSTPIDAERVIYIENDSFSLNLRSIYDSLYAAPTGVEVVRFVVLANVKVGSNSTSVASISTGNWPAGVDLTLENRGRIQGRGGDGGRGDGSDGDLQGGKAGGDALNATYTLTLDNTSGEIWAGAGGGGGGMYKQTSGTTFAMGSGGGGGAGFPGGAGGVGGTWSFGGGTNGNAGQPGTDTDGGNGGASAGGGGAGGNGGDVAQAGTAGQNTGQWGGGGQLFGGQPGRAIVGVSLITITGAGDIQGAQV